MTPEQFVYWMQGFAELNESPPSPEQWQSIREHLQLVFKKETPSPESSVFKRSQAAKLLEEQQRWRAIGPQLAETLRC